MAGYILDVDVEYPKELHQNHNMLPFIVERIKIGKVRRLVPNLNDKKDAWVTHEKCRPGNKTLFKGKNGA